MNETVSPPEVNTHAFWDDYMAAKWDANSGRQQTRLFAKYFLETVTLPADARTLLDVSCAKGDALPEFQARYPNLELFGGDISEVAIAAARSCYGKIARFEVAGFEDIARHYDIIFCSNTLEHFENYLDMAKRLLAHCEWLYILVPYLELRGGKPLTPMPGEQHVTTFDEQSFDSLMQSGAARKIQSWVRYTPAAWGNGPVPFWRKAVAYLRRRPAPAEFRQIFYEVQSSAPRVPTGN